MKSEYNQFFSRIHTTVGIGCLHLYYKERIDFLKGRILDLGCGNGEFVDYAKSKGRDIYGIDIHPLSKFIKGDITRLPFKGNSFDSVYSNSVIDHLSNPEEFISEIKRVLKKSGRMYISLNDVSTRKWKFFDDYTHKTPFTKKSIIQFLQDSGFRIININYIPLIPNLMGRLYHFPVLFNAISRLYGKIKKRQLQIFCEL
jgi:ubiquinone/menaquinone biosynthesis C-methylase UbiE